jgi:lipopolysaccharide assembly outer membrane protein LptD (OstA)
LLITATNHSVAQTGAKPDKPAVTTIDTIRRGATAVKSDTVFTPAIDSTHNGGGGGFLDDKVDYKASDSTVADLMNKKAYLYNHAEVFYQDMTLKAGYIEIDFGKKLVIAKGIVDSSGKVVQRPVFEQGPEKFTAGQITYNFETKKGKIKDVITQQGDGYIHGSDIKKDTNNVYYVAHGKYTTCDLEDDPHYYFAAKKIKVIPNDKVISGPAELFIADVPTPLILPFGYFPNKRGRRSGIVLPGYGRSDRLGYFLSRGGFYYGGNEFFDALITSDIYSNGGFTLREETNYSKRYKFRGAARFTYARVYTQNANPELAHQPKQNDYHVEWDHYQDPKAHPSSTFGSHIDYATSTYGKNNGSVTNDYLKTGYNSRINYNKTFTGTPFALNLSGAYNQNVLTRDAEIDLPQLSASMNRIFPFKNESRIGKRWYDQVGLSANLNASNQLKGKDSVIFKPNSLANMQNGAKISVPIGTSFTVLKYIKINPSINTNGYLYFKTFRQRYNKDSNKVYTDTVPEAKFFADANISTSINTTVYGDYYFKTKHLKQIHQIITPSVSLTYSPDFSEAGYGNYGRYYNDSTKQSATYPYFGTGIYGGPSGQKSETVSFNLQSTLEAKMKKSSDSGDVFKKVKLLDMISASLSYNAAAIKFKWSDLSLSARTRLFDKLDINMGAIYSLYHYIPSKSIDGEVIGFVPTDYFELDHGHLATLSSINTSISTSLRSKEKKKAENASASNNSTAPAPSPPVEPTDRLQYILDHPNTYVDFNIPWDLNLSYNVYYLARNTKDNLVQTFSFSGNLSLTQKWKISGTSGFDFKTYKFTMTSINIIRDLHCWEMHFSWVPFGYRQYFLLTINVKSSMLRDLQLKKQSQGTQNYGYQ